HSEPGGRHLVFCGQRGRDGWDGECSLVGREHDGSVGRKRSGPPAKGVPTESQTGRVYSVLLSAATAQRGTSNRRDASRQQDQGPRLRNRRPRLFVGNIAGLVDSHLVVLFRTTPGTNRKASG